MHFGILCCYVAYVNDVSIIGDSFLPPPSFDKLRTGQASPPRPPRKGGGGNRAPPPLRGGGGGGGGGGKVFTVMNYEKINNELSHTFGKLTGSVAMLFR